VHVRIRPAALTISGDLAAVAAIGRPRADAPAAAASEGGVAEAAAVATLHQLNADWVRSFIDCDRAWYSDHLADDFVGTLGDGRRINKHDFLRHLTEQPRAETVGCDEVDVHLLDDTAVALVHGVIHVRGKTLTLMRYTMIWQAKPQRWQAVAAQFTSLERGPSAANDVDGRPLASQRTNSRKQRRLRIHWPPSLPYGGSFRADGAAAQGRSEVWVPLQQREDRPLLCAERRPVSMTT
jgi:Domain of unknown function (DUF4440)